MCAPWCQLSSSVVYWFFLMFMRWRIKKNNFSFKNLSNSTRFWKVGPTGLIRCGSGSLNLWTGFCGLSGDWPEGGDREKRWRLKWSVLVTSQRRQVCARSVTCWLGLPASCRLRYGSSRRELNKASWNTSERHLSLLSLLSGYICENFIF